MTISKNNGKRRKGISIKRYNKVFFLISSIGILLTLYIIYRTSMSNKNLFSTSLLALFAGVLVETWRVSDDKNTVVITFVISYFFSLIAFIPGKHEQVYIFENHVRIWPYFFIVLYALIVVSFHEEKVTVKLTEGITLLQSLSLIYWIIDYGFIIYTNWVVDVLLVIVAIMTMFSIINAMTKLYLSKPIRLTLSIWSTIIMFIFGVDNIFRVFNNPDIESPYLPDVLYIGLQFFLLGISLIYILQNFILLARFIPRRLDEYGRILRETRKKHINRFLNKQVSYTDALLCLLYAMVFYGLNYKYKILPRHTMIWFVFVTFPLFLQLIDSLSIKQRIKNNQE